MIGVASARAEVMKTDLKHIEAKNDIERTVTKRIYGHKRPRLACV